MRSLLILGTRPPTPPSTGVKVRKQEKRSGLKSARVWRVCPARVHRGNSQRVLRSWSVWASTFLCRERKQFEAACTHALVGNIDAPPLGSGGCWLERPQHHRGQKGSQRSPRKDTNSFLMLHSKHKGVGTRVLKSHRPFP